MPSYSNKKKAILAASLAATLTQAQSFGNYSTISNASSSACPGQGGAHIIVARASIEPLGYGIIGAVKDHVLANSSASNAEYVVYPATLTDYFNSESDGVLGMKALVDEYLAKNCPHNAPIVLMGYSQGAQVVADYLSGQSVDVFPYNASLATAASTSTFSRLAAAVTMGDPSINITNNAFHVGNSTKSGLFARHANSSAVLNQLETKLQSYCDALDPYCASAGNFDHISVHLSYVEEYGQVASEFVLKKIEEYYAAANGTSSNGTMGASPTGSGMPAVSTGGAVSLRAGSTVAMVLALGAAFVCGL